MSNGGDNNLWLYFGKGDGTFDLPILLNGDGFPDLLLTAADIDNIAVQVF